MKRSALAFALASLLATACKENNNEEFRFRVETTRLAISQSFPVSRTAPATAVEGRYLAFLASESDEGRNLNSVSGDADTSDHVAVLVDMVAKDVTVLGVAARDFQFLGSYLFLEVDENADSKDWDADGTPDDFVLLQMPAAAPANGSLQYVATLRVNAGPQPPAGLPAGPHMLVTDNDRLFFVHAASASPAVDETTISMIRLNAGVPLAPLRLLNAEGAATLTPVLLGSESNVVYAALDEVFEGDLTGDSDTTDNFVLALIDAEEAVPDVTIPRTAGGDGLALAGASSPLRTLDVGAKRIVGFLVDEAEQGAGSLNSSSDPNNPLSYPAQCSADDLDATDEVLHHVSIDDTTHVVGTPVNTFLCGVDRVLLAKNGSSTFIATIQPESDEGNCATGLNGNDSDTLDRILRWVRADPTGGAVFSDVDGMVALKNLPGGTAGATDFAGRWVVVIDEAADTLDWDGSATDNDVVAWLDPTDGLGAQWTSDHDSAAAGIQPAGAAWMGEIKSRERVLLSFQESVANLAINGRDTDKLDSVPVFARFDVNDPDDFDFFGPAVATHDNRPGIVIANGLAFYRVDESDDNFDWNGDGDKSDEVLFRTTVTDLSESYFLSTLNAFDIPAITTDSSNIGAAFIVEEAMKGRLNADADTDDFVVQWMRVGP